MKKLVKYLFVTPASILAVCPAIVSAVSCGCSKSLDDPIKDVIPEDKLVIKNGVLSGFVDGFDATQYKTLSIPNTVHTISANAFASTFNSSECKMNKVIIPSSVVTIETKAFYANSSIQKYDISEFESVKNLSFASDAFGKSSSSGTILYPKDCSESLENSLDYLMCDAGLELGWFDTTKVREVEKKFLNIDENENILYGFDDTFYTVPHTSLFNKLVIPYEVAKIANNAFYRNNESVLKSIKDVQFQIDPETELTHVQYIGENAFRASSLENIVLKSGTTSIQSGAFQDCTSLANVTLPDTLITIKAKAFYRCTALTEITIPPTVTTIEGDVTEYKTEESKVGAFAGCSNITQINLLGIYKNVTWDQYAFYGLDKSKVGNIVCEPSLAPQWKIYFGNIGMVFTDNTWSITDKINILNGYTPLVSPYPIACEETKESIETIYFSQIENQPQILVDDLYNTFYQWTKIANQKNIKLDAFDALIKSVSADFEDKTISFNFHYHVKGTYNDGTRDNTFEATGNMNFKNLPLVVASASNSSSEEELKYVQLLSADISNDELWLLKFNETYTINGADPVTISPEKAIRCDNISQYKAMDVTKVGIFWKLNLFLEPIDETWTWGIVSPFLQNIKVKA